MGRRGITYVDVERAIIALQEKGLNPTVDAVRSILGTGSKSTIVPYLKKWRATQNIETSSRVKDFQSSIELDIELKILKRELNKLKEDLYQSEKNRWFLTQEKVNLREYLKKLQNDLMS